MKILIADKDPSLRALVATRLHVREYEVLEVVKSEEVLKILERENVDLILLSSEMEKIGGEHLIQKIRQWLHLAPVPVILMTEEDKIAELVMSQERGFDDFLIKPFNPLVLQLSVAMNISRARQRVEANALTHLPGNHAIERVVREKIEKGEKISILYIDINHFKTFNDRYGFEKGDDVIRQTSRILLEVAESMAPRGKYFVGHIGGDDFVIALHPDHEETFARSFITEFDRIMPTYYNEQDRKQGFVRVVNRQGKRQSFPLMSCSVAACTNLYRPYKNYAEFSQDLTEVKSFLKSQTGSHYLRDRRSAPIGELKEALSILAPEVEEKRALEKVHPLGQVLLDAGLISREQLTSALKKHLETGQRLGQVLINMNAVKSEDVGRMLEKKLNVPYISLRDFLPSREMLRLFTKEFIKSRRVIPLEVSEEGLRLAMCDPFDLRTLDAIERITFLKPVPRLALEDEFEEFIERYYDQPLGKDKTA